MTADLMDLAGSSEPAQRLLTAAVAELDGADLTHELRRWANLGAQRRDIQMRMCWERLADAVQKWQYVELTGDLPGDWLFDEIKAEIIGHLYELVHGQPGCHDCLNGWLTTLDAMQPEGACIRHVRRAVA